MLKDVKDKSIKEKKPQGNSKTFYRVLGSILTLCLFAVLIATLACVLTVSSATYADLSDSPIRSTLREVRTGEDAHSVLGAYDGYLAVLEKHTHLNYWCKGAYRGVEKAVKDLREVRSDLSLIAESSGSKFEKWAALREFREFLDSEDIPHAQTLYSYKEPLETRDYYLGAGMIGVLAFLALLVGISRCAYKANT